LLNDGGHAALCPPYYFAGYLAQQRADLGGGIIDFDLEHRISRLQFPLLRLELLSPGSLG
jgi:hypothetical protein